MPSFVRIFEDGREEGFHHPCFAWVGVPPAKGLKSIRLLFPNNRQGTTVDDAILLLNGIKQSKYLDKMGTDAYLHIKKNGFVDGIDVDIDMTKPGWVVFTTLKLVGKVFTYSPACFDYMLECLKAGLNFSQASVYSRKPQSYRYPFVSYAKGDAEWLYRYLINEEINWDSLEYWANGNRWTSNITIAQPYTNATFSSSCPDNPLGYAARNQTDRNQYVPISNLDEYTSFINQVKEGKGTYGS